MKTTNIQQVVSVNALAGLIARELALQEQEARIKEEREEVRSQIKASMHAAKLERHITPDGQQALIYQQERMSWDVDKLKDVLTQPEFRRLVPPTVNAKGIRAHLDALEAAGSAERRGEIRACATVAEVECLDVRPAAEVAEVEKPKAKKKSA